MKKFYFLLLFLLLSLTILFFVNNTIAKQAGFYEYLAQPATLINITELGKSSLALIFVGDIMLNRGVEYMVKEKGGGDFKWPFLKIADYLREADVLFGNLESVISNKGVRVGSIYSFRAEPKSIEGLTYAGFDVLSVANNHIFDYGRPAMEDNFNRLKEEGIKYVGGGFSEEEAHSPIIKDIKKTKIAYLAYTNLGSEYFAATKERSGIAWLDEGIIEDIKTAKESADIVIVSMHFGEEYQPQPSPNQIYFAQLAIDSGADLVIGHHSHIVQPIEKYNDSYIAYSLGNFVFDQGFSEKTMEGLVLEVLVKNGKINKVIPRNIKINNFFQPELVGER